MPRPTPTRRQIVDRYFGLILFDAAATPTVILGNRRHRFDLPMQHQIANCFDLHRGGLPRGDFFDHRLVNLQLDLHVVEVRKREDRLLEIKLRPRPNP